MSDIDTSENLARQVLTAIAKGMNRSKACRQFGVSPITLKKWERRRNCVRRSISFRGHPSSRDKTNNVVHVIPLGIRNIKVESQSKKTISNRGKTRKTLSLLSGNDLKQEKPVVRASGKDTAYKSQSWDTMFLEKVIGGWEGEPLERSPQPRIGKDEKLNFDLPEE